jgi:serine/threonine protein kinase
MELTSGLSGKTYRVSQALTELDKEFHLGFSGETEVLICLAANDTAEVAALRRLAALLDRFDTPQIIKLIDRGRTETHHFLVFERSAEQPLATLVREVDLGVTAALDVLVQVVDILATLHDTDLIWGRLRPQAFCVNKNGQVRLVDLRATGEPISSQDMTLIEASYLAPELGPGQPPTISGDIYACGVLAYELLVGQPPFAGATTAELAVKHITAPPPDLKRIRPELPIQLTHLIQCCLAKLPEERPASVVELYDELQAIQAQWIADEQARKVICPRCQTPVLPAERCSLCNAPLDQRVPSVTGRWKLTLPLFGSGSGVQAPSLAGRRWKRTPIIITIQVVVLSFWFIINALGSVDDMESSVSGISTPQPTATIEQSVVAETLPASPTPVPTATALPQDTGKVTAPADDVPDPNIDLIQAGVLLDDNTVVSELAIVGQFDEHQDRRTYQLFFDIDGHASGDRSTPWINFGADYTVIYQSGDAAGVVLRWESGAWQNIGTAIAAIASGQLTLTFPAAWLDTSGAMRYGALAINSLANLADYIPARDTAAAVATREER